MSGIMRRNRRGPVPLESQLTALADCGIALAPGVAAEALTESFSREQFEADPYSLVLTVMGGEAESDAQAGSEGYPSEHIWHFDPECIADGEDYVTIARRFRLLARGDLPIEDIRARISPDEAWISFQLEGREFRWNARVDSDWVDPEILDMFGKLLNSRRTGRRFTYCDLGGQDCLIGCSTPDEKRRLEELTGLSFQWLADSAATFQASKSDLTKTGHLAKRGRSQRVLVPEPDRSGRIIKIGWGAAAGFGLGFIGTITFLGIDSLALPVAVGIVGACILGFWDRNR